MNTEPVALLPVRLETRSDAGGSVLRIRIFPDDIHVDALDRGVSDEEKAAGQAYWTAVWAPPVDGAEPAVDAWAVLVGQVGPRRAAWVADALLPTNLDQRPGTPPAFPEPPARSNAPASVSTLPNRFQAFAFQGADVSSATGEAVPEGLQVGLPTQPSGPLQLKDGVPVVADELRWLVDFERATQVGMGIVLPLRHAGQRIDRLVVLGVRDDLDPAASAERLSALLQAHAYTDGAAFLPQGSPTNNTDTDRTAWSRGVSPAPPPTGVAPPDGSNAAVLARALDADPSLFAGLDHALDAEQPAAEAMQTALWATTWEVVLGKLTHPATPGRSFTPVQQDALRDHAIRYVRGRGPIPALRIGRQPYGVLPTTAFAPNGYAPFSADIRDAGLSGFLRNARQLWRAGVADVPTVMDGDLEQAMPEILGSSPVQVGLRVRSLTQVNKCYEPVPGLFGVQDNCASQAGIDQIVREFLGFDPTEVESNGQLGKASRVLALPLTEDGDIGYIDRLLETGEPPPGDARSVLQALLGLAAAIEADEWQRATGDEGLVQLREHVAAAGHLVDAQLVLRSLEAVAQAPFAAETTRIVAAAHEAISAVDAFQPFDRGALAAAYPVDAVRPAALVTAATRRTPGLLTDPHLTLQVTGEVLRINARNAEFREALGVLRGIASKDERALLLAELLDTCSHRLDAWLTSLATARLDGQRTGGGVRGLVLGAYGFVRNVEIDPPATVAGPADLGTVFVDRRDGGYVHAPSLDHAATAGILRSARLTHDPGDSGSPALDIDLSGGRVRLALHVLDGVRAGQPLGALLGYRLERRLHERSGQVVDGHRLELDRYVYVLRSIAPLSAAKLTDPGPEPVPLSLESVAAANVVDGVRLLGIAAAPGGAASIAARLASGPDDATLRRYLDHGWPAPGAGEVQAVLDEIAGLEQVHDAIADLLLAESVHQLARGNTAGAAAALDAAGGGDGIPPDPEVVRTPRSGSAFTHRLLVLAPAPAPAGQSGWSDDAPRAMAHPRLEAWARAQLGAARRVILQRQPQVTLAGHGLCALDVVADAGPVLRRRLGIEPLATRPAAWKRDTDRLLLAEAEQLAETLRDLLQGARPLTATALAAPRELAALPRSLDLDALSARATAARNGLDQAAASLGQAVQAVGDVAKALTALLPYGVRPPAPVSQTAADDLPRIGTAVATAAQARVAAADAALAAAAGAPDQDRLRLLGDALTAVFGPGLPALVDVRPPAADDELVAALAAAAPADGSQVRPWLSNWAAVRRGVGRYADSVLLREALGQRQHLRVAQLPTEAAGQWVGLPFADGQPPAKGPVLSLVVELPGGAAPSGRETLAGFVVDEWVDVVPRRVVLPNRDDPDAPGEVVALTTSAAAVNAHAPSARPPQAVLLAVTPDGQAWTIEKLLAVVEDTFRLAQERAVTLERVPLAPRLLPALYVDDWSLQGQADSVLFVSNLLAQEAVLSAIPRFVKG